jgi:hypothetical protein
MPCGVGHDSCPLLPERRDHSDIRLNAGTARPNFDLNTWKTILRFVLIDGRRLFGKTDLFFDSSGDWATEQEQEKTIKPITDRLIHLDNFYPDIPGDPKDVSDRERRMRSVRNCPFFEIAPRRRDKQRVPRQKLNAVRSD